MLESQPTEHRPGHNTPRVLIVTESFLPQINGVTNSVLRVLEHLQIRGYRADVIAPTGPDHYAGATIHRVGGLDLPGYDGFIVGLATRRRLRDLMQRLKPDVVHVSSPFVLGSAAVRAANSLQIPVVSIYQTDVVGFARRYRLAAAEALIEHRVRRIHIRSDLTLVPSTASITQLQNLGVPRLRYWPRGIDTTRFAPTRRSEELRQNLLEGGPGSVQAEVLIGYVGRLAREKDLHHLQAVQSIPGAKLVMIGEGPEREHLEQQLPEARFLGAKHGEELAEMMASLDIFVHTGAEETFCQAVQEALASGVPVIGPDSGGLRDRIQHGVNGLHYAPGDTAGLGAAVRELVANPSRRREMGGTATRQLRNRSWATVNDQLIEHYLDAISGAERCVPSTAAELYRQRELHELAV